MTVSVTDEYKQGKQFPSEVISFNADDSSDTATLSDEQEPSAPNTKQEKYEIGDLDQQSAHVVAVRADNSAKHVIHETLSQVISETSSTTSEAERGAQYPCDIIPSNAKSFSDAITPDNKDAPSATLNKQQKRNQRSKAQRKKK